MIASPIRVSSWIVSYYFRPLPSLCERKVDSFASFFATIRSDVNATPCLVEINLMFVFSQRSRITISSLSASRSRHFRIDKVNIFFGVMDYRFVSVEGRYGIWWFSNRGDKTCSNRQMCMNYSRSFGDPHYCEMLCRIMNFREQLNETVCLYLMIQLQSTLKTSKLREIY